MHGSQDTAQTARLVHQRCALFGRQSVLVLSVSSEARETASLGNKTLVKKGANVSWPSQLTHAEFTELEGALP